LKNSDDFVTKPLDISNVMNDHFVTVGEKLVEKLLRNNSITINVA
jgi:hypothetical protein